jgi:hypothetical protein
MAKKVNDGYMCTSCEKIYPTPARADACRDSHEIVYVPMNKTELNRLINGIFLNDISLIPESLLITLRKIQMVSVRDGVQKEM